MLLTIGNLRGVTPAGDTLFLLRGTNQPQSFNWEKYGLTLFASEGILLPLETCEVAITALAGGDFEFPKGSELVSAVYAIYISISLLKPLTVNMQHCVALETPEQCSCLQFVRAPLNNGTRPYQFKPLPGGRFMPGSQYGSISCTEFCLIAEVLMGESGEEQQEGGHGENGEGQGGNGEGQGGGQGENGEGGGQGENGEGEGGGLGENGEGEGGGQGENGEGQGGGQGENGEGQGGGQGENGEEEGGGQGENGEGQGGGQGENGEGQDGMEQEQNIGGKQDKGREQRENGEELEERGRHGWNHKGQGGGRRQENGEEPDKEGVQRKSRGQKGKGQRDDEEDSMDFEVKEKDMSNEQGLKIV